MSIFEDSFFAEASWENPRITAQQGSFILEPFPMCMDTEDMQIRIYEQYNPQKIIVPAKYKQTIKDELQKNDISKETLFPQEPNPYGRL